MVNIDGEKKAHLWNAKTGAQIAEFSSASAAEGENREQIVRTAISPDGGLLVTGGEHGSLRLWQTDPVSLIDALNHETYLEQLTFSPNGGRILSADSYSIRPWDANGEADVLAYRSPPAVTSLGHDYEGRLVDFPDEPGVMRLEDGSWGPRAYASVPVKDSRSGDTLLELKVNGFNISAAQFVLFEGKLWVAMTLDDDSDRLWRFFSTTQELVDYAIQAVPRCLSSAPRSEAFLDSAPPAWCIEREKWPYATQAWKEWLAFKRANANPPLPYMPECNSWRAEHLIPK